jgi:hypothetical protein
VMGRLMLVILYTQLRSRGGRMQGRKVAREQKGIGATQPKLLKR